jgi:hypothetical protein
MERFIWTKPRGQRPSYVAVHLGQVDRFDAAIADAIAARKVGNGFRATCNALKEGDQP